MKIFGSAIELKEVIINMILNSFDAIEKTGKISIGTTVKNNIVKIMIADNGKGMTKDEIHNAFTPYFTTKKKGTGLGLSLSLKIIRSHKGNIKIDSTPLKGTIFTITLPIYNLCLTASSINKNNKIEKSDEQFDFKNIFKIEKFKDTKILLVDDNRLLRTSIVEFFRLKKLNITEAENKAEAIEKLHKDTFSIAIIDMSLPDGSGVDIAKIIMEKYHNTRIIFTTGSIDINSEKILRMDLPILQKPFKLIELYRMINNEISINKTKVA